MIHTVDIHELVVAPNRQRKEFKAEEIVKLANSISQVGLIHPVVIRRDDKNHLVLVAGERRIKAMLYVWNFGQKFKCGEQWFEDGQVPCIYQGEMDPIDAYEMELEENIRREDLSWQEKAQATRQLFELRSTQAERRGEAPPSVAEIAQEVRGDSGSAYNITREELIVSKNLDDPDVAKAKSANEAFKILKRKEELRKSAELGELVGKTFSADLHSLYHGDCLEILPVLSQESVDVILTDPPYGIDADKYGDSGGKTGGAHFYTDDFDTWSKLMQIVSIQLFKIAKPQAHAYLFCDIDNFVFLKSYMKAAGWRCFRTPIIWINPTAMRLPWPEHGPQRKYQICLFAIKGDRQVTRIYPDVVAAPSDENLNHQAQKPIALYQDLLKRSIRPGDVVLDPFCGTGTIFPAAHELKCKAIGIEVDPSAYGISVERLNSLK